MQNQEECCVGCKTHFEQKSKLPLQGISIELKNYQLPIKDQRQKWNLLRTICSFLNTKGGTIFIGAEDKTGEIHGISMQRKQQDDFKIFIQQLIQRIQPKLDLSDREDVFVQFVPIDVKGKFKGKYLIKIVVKQGCTNQLYCFSQKIQLLSNDKKNDDFEIWYSYKRLNSSTIKQLKGYELLTQTKNKAIKPLQIYNCFHDGCNPQPPHPQAQILKLGFFKIYQKQIRDKLQNIFQCYLNQLKINDYGILDDIQNQLLVVQFQTKVSFDKVNQFLNKNIKQLNNNLINQCQFVKKDIYLNFQIYQNVFKKQFNKNQNNKKQKFKKYHPKYPSSQIQYNDQVSKQSQGKKQQSTDDIQEQQDQIIGSLQGKDKIQKGERITTQEKGNESKKKDGGQQKGGKKLSRKFPLTFTHIEPSQREQLVITLETILPEYRKQLIRYHNSIQVFFESDKKRVEYYKEIQKIRGTGILQKYGFRNEIIYGINKGMIRIRNSNKSKINDFKRFLQNIIKNDVQRIQAISKGNGCQIYLYFTKISLACHWLDNLLMNKTIKQFKTTTNAKLKMHLICENETLQKKIYYNLLN